MGLPARRELENADQGASESGQPIADPPGVIASGSSILDGAFYGILLGNGVTLAGALFQHWPALPVLWVYWGQSVTIGILNVIRILRLEDFSTKGFTENGKQIPETTQGKVSTARFFAMHFGFFHLVYAMFLASGKLGRGAGTWAPLTVVLNVVMFAGIHGYSLLKSGGHDLRQQKPNLGTLMFYPYLRIVPMHLAIILGSMFPPGALPIFMVLKTGADAGMHLVERILFRATE